MPNITPNLWFDAQAEEAAAFYVSIFPNSKVGATSYYGEAGPGPAGTVLTVSFTLDGKEFLALNGGPQFTFDEAVSFAIMCKDQAEIDYYWDRLTAGGGVEGPCGWLKDRYGLSWQVVPEAVERMMTDPDERRRDRAMKAVLSMKKLDLAAIEAAANAA